MALTLLIPLSASAVCPVEPLEPRLRAADVVYVGTVVRSELASELPPASAPASRSGREIRLRHTLQPGIRLKGDPAAVPDITSLWQHDPPTSDTVVRFAERVTLMPGDTILVVARGDEPVRIGPCTATRKWDVDTAQVVRAVFPHGR